MSMPPPYRYKRIFAYGSLQFCGHIEEYLAKHTAELSVMIVQPRVGQHQNFLRRYSGGVLMEERALRSSQNLFVYYALWYIYHLRALWFFSTPAETTIVFAGHPIAFFGMSFLRCFRPLLYVYWIGDYFPSTQWSVRLYEWVKRRYHARMDVAYYLSDAINRVMNDTMLESPHRRTVMWGLKPYDAFTPPPMRPFSLLFVGLIRPGQGIEMLFDFLSSHRDYRLNMIGVCQPNYFAQLQKLLDQLDLHSHVFFPNRFYSEAELLTVAHTCHVGIALYDTAMGNFTHYADPGKVKAYAEMRLPVVMTRVSDIVGFVEKFGSGEVVEHVDEISDALERIRMNYPYYQAGIAHFIEYFEFDRYYQKAFSKLEEA